MKAAEIAGSDPGLRDMLAGAGLPVDDLAEPGRVFFAFNDEDGHLIGYCGFEPLGHHVLMRSLVIADGRRGTGNGLRILDWMLGHVRTHGAADAWMLTTNAAAFGAACGFQPVDRAAVPDAIRATRQFEGLCPASAAIMRKPLC